MAVAKMAQVPEALQEVTVHSTEGPCLLAGRRQRALCRKAMQENCSSMVSFGAFPAQGSELLSRLDRGEDAWVPDLRSSDDSADEGPVKPTLKRWPKAGMWWDVYRSPVKYTTTSDSSEDEQESEDEEEKRPRRGHKLTILRRNVLGNFKGNGSQSAKQTGASKNRPQLKKHPRAQLGKMKCNATEVGDVAPRIAKEKAPGGNCGQAFKAKASHSGEWPYKCSFCGERFTAKKVLASHQRGHAEERGYKHPSSRKHPKAYLRERPFECPTCGKCFQRKSTLTAHLNIHTGERPYRCPKCENAFTRKDHLERHQRSHVREKGGRRPKGEREARAAISLDAPEENSSAASVSEGTFLSGLGADRQQGIPPNLYKCRFCGRCMRTKVLLVDHERIHREEMPYKCSQCQKSFLHKNSFLQHEATHRRKAACERPVRMSAKYTHSASRITPTAGNPSAVPTDGGKVTNVFNLSQHPRTPGGERVYKCQYCGKCLSGSGPLTNHEKLHRRGRSYKCPDCVKCFSRKDNLLQHRATHKKPVGRPRLKSIRSEPERIHTELKPRTDLRDCIVTRSVARSLSLSKHPKSYTEGKVYKCQYCGEHTRTKSLLVNHERIHRRTKKLYQCLECGKSFYQKNYLASHQRGHVRKKLSKCSNTDQKMTTDNPRSLKRANPQRRKAPWLCFKCGKRFDCKYNLTRHQRTHLAEKPFKCVCGKGFVEMWHLKRHETTQLNKKCHKKLLGAEGKRAILNSANGVHPEEKNRGELPVNTEPPTASSTVERNILPDTEEENTHSLVALAEASEVEILDISEQGGNHAQAQVELSEHSQQNSLQKSREGNVSVSQPVESERKLSGEDGVILRYKQDDHSEGEQVHQRHSCKRARLQSHEREKVCVRWQLRSQAMMLRRRSKQKMQLVGKQARSCFCQQEGPKMMPRKKPGLLQACKKVETCSGPQRNLHTAAFPKGNSDSESCTAGKCDAVSIGGQEDLQELPPVPERSPLESCERAQPADELQKESLQNMVMMPRWKPSPPGACKVETCSGPQRNQHTVASSSLLKSAPKGFEPGELGFCPPSQRMFSRESQAETAKNAALEMLPSAELKKDPKEVLERESKGNSGSGSCTAGKYDAIAIGGQEDLQDLPPVPERSPLPSGKRAQPADEVQKESLQNMVMMPRWKPSPPGACKVETCSGPQRKQHTVASSSLLKSAPKGFEPGELGFCPPSQRMFSTESQEETAKSAALEMLATCAAKEEVLVRESKGNSGSGSCTTGEYNAVAISEQEDLQELPPVPERSPLENCERAQAANELQNAHQQPKVELVLSGEAGNTCPQSCKKETGSAEPQTAIAAEPTSPAPWDEGVSSERKSETTQLKYECSQCDQFFESQAYLESHKRSHKCRPFLCTHCRKGFPAVHTLNVHMRIHTGEKPFKCPECDYRCNVSANLNRHRRKTHNWKNRQLPKVQRTLSGEAGNASPQSCKKERGSAEPQTAIDVAVNQGELGFCPPSQTTFSTKSKPETIKNAALEMLATCTLKNEPKEVLETECKGNSGSESCTAGKYNAVAIGGQEDLQGSPPVPERSLFQSGERAQPADELQNAHQQPSLLKSAPQGFEPGELGFCPPPQTMFSPTSKPETAKSSALETLPSAELKTEPKVVLKRECKDNLGYGSCTAGKCDAVSIGGQEDLQDLPPVPERSLLPSCKRAQPADELQNASLQNTEMMPRWKPSPPGACKVETCSGPQRNQHTVASSSLLKSAPKGFEPGELGFCPSSQTMFSTTSKPEIIKSAALEMLATCAAKKEVLVRESKGNSGSGSCTTGEYNAVAISGQEDLQELPPVPERSFLQSCERAQAANELQNAHQQPKVELVLSGEAGNTCPQSCKKERGSAEPQTAIAAEPTSPAPWDEGVSSERKSETTPPKYECSQCDQFFESQAYLESHKRSHKCRPFLCTHCRKGFPSVHTLNVHMRIHTGEKPFKCPECDYRCNVSANLNRHRRKTHNWKNRQLPKVQRTLSGEAGNASPQSCKKERGSAEPQTAIDVAVNQGELGFCPPSQTTFSTKSKPETIKNAALEMLATCTLKNEPKEVLETECKGNSGSESCTAGKYNAVAIGGQEDLQGSPPVPERSLFQSGERAQPADELQNAHQQPSLLKSAPQGFEPGELGFCPPPQTMFSPTSKPETAKSSALETLPSAELKTEPKVVLKRECKDNLGYGSCTAGKCDAVSIGGQEDLQDLPPVPERSLLPSCKRAQPADELQNASLQNTEMMPRWKPSPPGACKVETCSGPQRNQHTVASSSLLKSAPKGFEPGELGFCPSSQTMFSTTSKPEIIKSAALEMLATCAAKKEVLVRESKGNSGSGSCTTGEYNAVAISGQEDLQELPPVPERSFLQSCERAQAANELQNAHQQPKVELVLSGEAGNTCPQSCKKERGSAEPQTAIAAEPTSPAPWDEGVSSERKSETTPPKYECSQCDQFFESQAYLESHKRSHKCRPFLCTHCRKGFPAVHTLNVHMRIHTGEKPFKCPECDYRCNVSANLNRHRRKTHNWKNRQLPKVQRTLSGEAGNTSPQSCKKERGSAEPQNQGELGFCPPSQTTFSTKSKPEIIKNAALEMLATCTLKNEPKEVLERECKGNTGSESSTAGKYDAVAIGGQEDLQGLPPVPERSPLENCERAQPADELQNAHQQPSLLKSAPKGFKPGELGFCPPPQTTFSPTSKPETTKSSALETLPSAELKNELKTEPKVVLKRECKDNLGYGSCIAGKCDAVSIGGQEDLQELPPVPEISPLEICERAQPADEPQKESLQNMVMMPRWKPSPPAACKVETCSGPQWNQHTVASSSLLKSAPKGFEPGELGFCPSSQTMFSTESQEETAKSAALETLPIVELKKEPKEVLESESKGNSGSESCTAGKYDAVAIGGQEDLQELPPVPERSLLQSGERAQAANELQNAHQQPKVQLTLSGEAGNTCPQSCKEERSSAEPQTAIAAEPTSPAPWDEGVSSERKSETTQLKYECSQCDQFFESQAYLESHKRSHKCRPFLCTHCRKGFPAVHTLNVHMRTHTGEKPFKCPECDYRCNVSANLNRHRRKTHSWKNRQLPKVQRTLSGEAGNASPQSCKKERGSAEPQTAIDVAVNQGELGFCPPSQTTFSTTSKPETIKNAALEMLATCTLKNEPKEVLERECKGNTGSGSCTAGKYNVVAIGGQEDLQGSPPVPERSLFQSGERAQAANELQNAHQQPSLLKSAPQGFEPGELGFCPPPQTMFSPTSKPETAKSSALETLPGAELKNELKNEPKVVLKRECKDNLGYGSCTAGKCDAVSIGGQEDLQDLPPVPERSLLPSGKRAQPADELQKESLQNMEMMPRWKPSPPGDCKVESCSGPQRNQHTVASSSLLKSAPKGFEPGELGFCPPSQMTFSPTSKPETAKISALEMLPIAELKEEPREVLESECKGNSGSESCTAGKYDTIAIGGQEDLQELPPVPERSLLQSCERAQAANELQNAHQQPKVQLTLSGEAGNTCPQSCKEERSSAEPQTAIAAEPTSPAPWDEGVSSERKSETTQLKYECSQCDQFFESQAYLESHKRSHKCRPFLCTHCRKGFPSVHTLNAHMRTHTGEKPFKCPECDFCCNASANLNKHRKRTHIQKGLHLCHLCGKSFLFSHSLAVHLQLHSGKEPYACADCGQMFLRKNLLVLHRRYKHQSEAV